MRGRGRLAVASATLLLGLSLRAADSPAEALSAGRFQDALRMADTLLQAQPRDARLWTVRGLALGGLGRQKEGLASFDRALRLDPSFLPALKAASELAYRSRDGQAASYLEKLLRLDPSNDTAHAMAAVLAFEAHDCRSAIPHFERSLRQVDGSELASSQFGHCLLQQGLAEQAVEVFERLLAGAPDNSNARYNLAVAQLQARRAAAAMATLAPLASTSDAETLNLLAAAQATDGRLEAAIRSLRRAAQLSPEDERNYLDLAILCHKEGALEVASEVLDAGLRRLPRSARLHAMRGVLYAERSELDKATADFEQAGQLEPDLAYASLGLSVLLGQTGRLEGATRLLREKLALTPDDHTLNYLLADSLLREGAAPGQPEFAEAREVLLRSIRVRPDFTRAHTALGKVYLQEGDAAGAVRELEVALRYDPENRPALSQLMLALRKLGRNQEAAATAERLRRQYEQDLQTDAGAQRLRIAEPAADRR